MCINATRYLPVQIINTILQMCIGFSTSVTRPSYIGTIAVIVFMHNSWTRASLVALVVPELCTITSTPRILRLQLVPRPWFWESKRYRSAPIRGHQGTQPRWIPSSTRILIAPCNIREMSTILLVQNVFLDNHWKPNTSQSFTMPLQTNLKQTNLKNFLTCFFIAMGQVAFGFVGTPGLWLA